MRRGELSHLDWLESEAIHIMREVAAQFERPALLFSGGKDSICMLRVAEKAFRPGSFPFPLVHIDTGFNFPEVLKFRDRRAAELGERLIVRTVEDALARGVADEGAYEGDRNRLQIPTLLDAIEEFRFDALMGGARRDEEKSRAKERVFSFRDEFGQWEPRKQRPELWNLYNGRIKTGEHIRAFPISNWTELDVWNYIGQERLEIPSIYRAHKRFVVDRNGQWISADDESSLTPWEKPELRQVRYRTVGDMLCTGAIDSAAFSTQEIIAELSGLCVSERSSRADDQRAEAAMEERKREGYF